MCPPPEKSESAPQLYVCEYVSERALHSVKSSECAPQLCVYEYVSDCALHPVRGTESEIAPTA